MITINKILGNIKKDSLLDQKYRELFEKNLVENVMIRRSESEKVRMRKTSDKGTDIGFILPPGTRLKDQDVVFLDDKKMIMVKLSTELVAVISFKSQSFYNDQNQNYFNLIKIAIKIGHTIGNLHRPLKLEENKIIFPRIVFCDFTIRYLGDNNPNYTVRKSKKKVQRYEYILF